MRQPNIIWAEIQLEASALQDCLNEPKKDFISIEDMARRVSKLFNEFAEVAHEGYLKEITNAT